MDSTEIKEAKILLLEARILLYTTIGSPIGESLRNQVVEHCRKIKAFLEMVPGDIPVDVMEAKAYIRDCEEDLGFMGSPQYFQAKDLIDRYTKGLAKSNFNQNQKI